MQNYFGTLFLDLSNHIKTAVPEVRWIDQDFNQLEIFEYRPEVSFPCVLIDVVGARYSELANLAQIGEITINVRIGFAPFSKSYQLAPNDVREKALEYYNLEQKIFEAVQGWQNDFTQPLIRTASSTERRDGDPNGLRVRVLTFTTMYEDDSAVMQYNKTAADLDITSEIV